MFVSTKPRPPKQPARPPMRLVSSFLIFGLTGPPVGLIVMLGPKRFLVFAAISAFSPIVLIDALLSAYLLGLVPALVTGLVWACARRLGVWLRVTATVGTGIVSTWPIARFFIQLPFVFGGWVWLLGGVSALVCCVVALRREARCEQMTAQIWPPHRF